MQVEITDLYVYPIKSCAGLRLQSSTISARGLAWDREWMITDSEGNMATQRTLPQMALITPSVTETHLHLTAPGMAPFRISLDAAVSRPMALTVWQSRVWGYDEGDAVGAWLTMFLNTEGESYRLWRTHPQSHRRIDQAWLSEWKKRNQGISPMLSETEFAFADGFPFLICNAASLDDLNARIQEQGDEPISIDRFRPNIVISGLEAYAEDNLLTLSADEHRFARLKHCTRCKLPNVNPATAEVGPQPWNTLLAYRRFPKGLLFGINAGLSALGADDTIQVGQALAVTFESD